MSYIAEPPNAQGVIAITWHDPEEKYQLQPGEVDVGATYPDGAALAKAFPGYVPPDPNPAPAADPLGDLAHFLATQVLTPAQIAMLPASVKQLNGVAAAIGEAAPAPSADIPAVPSTQPH